MNRLADRVETPIRHEFKQLYDDDTLCESSLRSIINFTKNYLDNNLNLSGMTNPGEMMTIVTMFLIVNHVLS